MPERARRGTSVPLLTWAEVCARRLARHGLTPEGGHADPADAVAAMAGTHAQMPGAAELAVGLRTEGATRSDVRAALWEERRLIRTFGLRGTVHLFPAADLPLWVAALSAVPQPANNGFAEDIRMTPEQTGDVLAAVAEALREAEEGLTVDELSEEVVARTGPWAGDPVMPAFQTKWPRWRQAMHLAGIRGHLCFGPNRGRKVTYTSPARFLGEAGRAGRGTEPADRRAGLSHVVAAYLHAYGPSTPKRFAHWLSAPARWAEEVFASLGDELEQVDVEAEGRTAWVSAGDTATATSGPESVHLLPHFDGYAYRVGNQPPELLYPGRAAERVLPGNFQPLLVDGAVAGLWHHRRSGRHLDITVESLIPLRRSQRDELERRADRVGEILEATPRLTLGPVTVGSHA